MGHDSPIIFPYSMYDMILLWQSTVGNFLQSRKDYWVRAQADIFSVNSDDLRRTALQMKDGMEGNAKIPPSNVYLAICGLFRLITPSPLAGKSPSATNFSARLSASGFLLFGSLSIRATLKIRLSCVWLESTSIPISIARSLTGCEDFTQLGTLRSWLNISTS